MLSVDWTMCIRCMIDLILSWYENFSSLLVCSKLTISSKIMLISLCRFFSCVLTDSYKLINSYSICALLWTFFSISPASTSSLISLYTVFSLPTFSITLLANSVPRILPFSLRILMISIFIIYEFLSIWIPHLFFILF